MGQNKLQEQSAPEPWSLAPERWERPAESPAAPGTPDAKLAELCYKARALVTAACSLAEGRDEPTGLLTLLDHVEALLKAAEHIANRLPRIDPEDMREIEEATNASN